MRKVIKIGEEVIRDKKLTSEDFRVYSYLLSIEKHEIIDLNKISKKVRLSIKEVNKSIKRLAELGYTADMECTT